MLILPWAQFRQNIQPACKVHSLRLRTFQICPPLPKKSSNPAPTCLKKDPQAPKYLVSLQTHQVQLSPRLYLIWLTATEVSLTVCLPQAVSIFQEMLSMKTKILKRQQLQFKC